MFVCQLCNKTYKTGLALGGHMSGHVRRRELAKEVIDKSHQCKVCGKQFKSGRQMGGHSQKHRIPFEQLKGDRARRFRLLDENGHHCSVCLQDTHMSKPIPLEIDHIDGNSSNNERSNLRILCCNCHAQTDTFRGRNIGNNPDALRAGTLKKYYGRYRQQVSSIVH